MHAVDARVKVIITLAFIITLNLLPVNAWAAYILFLGAILSAGLVSRLGLGFLLRRSVIALPFVLAAAPLIFIGPGARLPLSLVAGWSFSPAGLERFAAIAVRAWISLQAAILLAATTPFPKMLAALRQLGLPAILTAVIGLMWRYLFIIADEARRMLQARLSRSPQPVGFAHAGGRMLRQARVTGGMAGSLFLRSIERSERVYAAMLARGYNGEPPGLEHAPLGRRERLILAAAGLLLLVMGLFGLLGER